MMKTVVLWVSRHKPLPAQIETLKAKLGSIEIHQLDFVPNAEHVIEKARELKAKVIVPVLPLSIIARLAEAAHKEGFTVLYARMEAVATTRSIEEAVKIINEKPSHRTMMTYADGTVRVHEFIAFEKVVEVKLVTEPW